MSLVDSVICLLDCGTVEVLINYLFSLNITGNMNRQIEYPAPPVIYENPMKNGDILQYQHG